MSKPTEPQFDIVIAGGGMAGSTLAWALLQAKPELKLAIIEQQADSVSQVSFDSRSIALAAGSAALLQHWGLWAELEPQACGIAQIHVSDRGHFAKATLTAEEYRQKALGYVVEVERLGALLAKKLAGKASLSRFAPANISCIVPQQDRQQLTLADGRTLDTRLLLIAEGGQSQSRALAGFTVQERSYQQHAIIANLALKQRHQQNAYERFTEQGPIALLPLPDQRYSLVYTVDDTAVEHIMQLDDQAFVAHVQQAFGYRAGVFNATGKRVCYPLSLRLSGEIVRHRVALLGNSLHNLHPIAGQGFNLALRDIAELVWQVSSQSADIGGYSMLRAYEQARQKDLDVVSTATDSLVRLFSNRSRSVALLRNIGLLTMTLFDDIKRPLAEHAMGLRS
ncbi:2-octaprenyl-6-methoxyphenyl hydroxylase [Rheinheimera maricola]|uniref:2-octaprenyl-6-methoxyphenyl hydroxylase n=1 Tax=Rheinheimera maricola TaxID=2793282 RepID=A0ABS7X8L7_9GAMM|nr:2-octaprenyl-6-methoxyphenyl hydroxylase [Rheinheimera maricola]MBZ9611883.1 2-octaprenyl-6-methoxyphenyl hydroxylase [Rheinheimera maricola]